MPRSTRYRLAQIMIKHEWNWPAYDDTIRGRVYQIVSDRHPWWDWGHRVMWLTGRYDSGSAGWPRARDLYYVHPSWLERFDQSWFAGSPTRLGFITTTKTADVLAHRSVSWKIFDLQDGGRTLLLGWYPEPGSDGRIKPASIEGDEIRLFWHWYWIDHKLKAQWLGIRPWLYSKALTAAVHERKPFACQVTPEPGSGGYSHWHCQLKKRHTDPHRYNNYTWAGPGTSVAYDPEVAR
jgi:hypothetical protein